MINEIFIYAGLLILTVMAPWASLLLFVLFSPWNILAEALGSDFRLGWSLLLAVRAAFAANGSPSASVPRTAIWTMGLFSFLAYARYFVGMGQLPPYELERARMALLYVVVAACAGYSILKLTDTKRRLTTLLSATALGLIGSSGYGLAEAKTLYTADVAGGRIVGPLGNANYFAAYLALAAAVLLLAWRMKLHHRIWTPIAVAAASVACILTFSRMGAVACCLGLWLTLVVRKTGPLLNWKLVLSGVLVASLAAGVSIGYLAETRRNVSYSDDESKAAKGQLTQQVDDLSRLEAVEFALQKWLDNPLWGVGFSTIAARNYVENGIYVTTHDTFVQVLSGTGLAGATLVGLALAALMRSVPATVRRFLFPVGAEFGLCCLFADFLGSIDIIVLLATLIVLVRQLAVENVAEGEPEYAEALTA